MTLINGKNTRFGAWLVGLAMILIPMHYYCDPTLGYSALRIGQEQAFQVIAIVLFAMFILQNAYIALFLLWAVFVYAYYSFPAPSGIILLSLFSACIYYEATYRCSDESKAEILFKFIAWFAVANLVYMAFQANGWEVLYNEMSRPGYQNGLIGFMGLKAITGMLFALAIPFIAYRYPLVASLFFIPIYLSESSCAVVAAGVAYLWQIWHVSRKAFYILLGIFCIGGFAYSLNDSKAGMFTDRQNLWKVALRDAVKKPLTGYGIDSFRCVTPDKQFIYWKNVRTKESFRIDQRDLIEFQHTGKFDSKKYGKFMRDDDTTDPWDNPHNEFIQLFYEFGVIPFIILGFLVYDMRKRFNPSNELLIPIVGFFLAVLTLSLGQFPFHLARIGIFIPIFLALYYKLTETKVVDSGSI